MLFLPFQLTSVGRKNKKKEKNQKAMRNARALSVKYHVKRWQYFEYFQLVASL